MTTERLQPGLRLTASDRPGVAQPVPERDIPAEPWPRMAAYAFVLFLGLVGAWEVAMRAKGLRPGDLQDSPSAWAEQRRRIDHEPVKVVIVSDSKLLYGTNLDRFEVLTGIRPVQLALAGTSARPFLEDLADDENFKGLAIVGMSEIVFFRDAIGRSERTLGFDRKEPPGDRVSFVLHRALEQVFAFIDSDHRLSVLTARLDRQQRAVDRGPYKQVWKLGEAGADRQTIMWRPVEQDPFLREHGRLAWNRSQGPDFTQDEITRTQTRTKAAVDKIRARGGEVVFVRPPSAPEHLVNEYKRLPREAGWDALLQITNARGFHFNDTPESQGLEVPEWSHLSGACAVVFTDVFVRHVATLTDRLTLRADAPEPLSAPDCDPTNSTIDPRRAARAGDR